MGQTLEYTIVGKICTSFSRENSRTVYYVRQSAFILILVAVEFTEALRGWGGGRETMGIITHWKLRIRF